MRVIPVPIRQIKLRVRILVERDEGGFHAFAPDLKGLHAGGGTEAEVRANVKDAVIGYVESLIKHNDPIPVGVLVSDGSYSIVEFVVKTIRDRLSHLKAHSYIEEVAVPTHAALAA